MNAYSTPLMALIAPLSLCLAAASAQSQPRAAIVTGEVHNAPSREIEFRHEPLLAPGPSQHYIALDEQNRFALLLNIPKGIFVTGHYEDEHRIPFFVEPGDSLHVVVTFAEATKADSLAAVESDHSHSADDAAPLSYSLTFNGRGAENNRFLAEFRPQYRYGHEAYVDARWPSFEESNPFPEYTEALQAEMNRLLTLQPGQLAPDFTLKDLDGQLVSLSQFKGKVVLLDFWASWCGPCIADFRSLRKIKQQMAAQPVVFLNISKDVDEGDWKWAIAKHEIKGVHVRSEQVAQVYNVSGIPRYYLVDPQGLIVAKFSRVWDVDEIVAKIEENL